jgi:hypothetical protein
MSDILTQALHRVALVFVVGGCIAVIYCAAFALLTNKSAQDFLPSIMLGYAVLAAMMLSRGVRSEQGHDLSAAVTYYTRALGYHLVATVAYILMSASGPEV